MQRFLASAFSLFLCAGLAGCGQQSSVAGTTASSHAPLVPATATTPITHIIVIMQENRSFDHLFQGFPGADTSTTGMNLTTEVTLKPIAMANTHDPGHGHTDWWRDWDNGKMDGWGKDMTTYSYINKSEVKPYWTLAQTYTLGDRTFQSNTGPSFPAHQYMIAGQSGDTSSNPSGAMWGCDADSGDRVALVGPNGTELPGVFPCFDYQTMGDLLDNAGVSWRYYAPEAGADSFFILSAFQAIRHIRYGPDWTNNVVSPETSVLTDIANGHLAQVSWVVPAFNNSDHPGAPNQGPDWVASIVNAVGASQYWNSTAVVISWDDSGGWYDHVPPPQIDSMGLGFRVPFIVVSPYARHAYISHVQHEQGSVLHFIEKDFRLPSLGTRDALSDDLSDCFDFTQKPTAYTHVQTAHTVQFFLSQKPSGAPDDD